MGDLCEDVIDVDFIFVFVKDSVAGQLCFVVS